MLPNGRIARRSLADRNEEESCWSARSGHQNTTRKDLLYKHVIIEAFEIEQI